MNSATFSRTPFLQNTSARLLLICLVKIYCLLLLRLFPVKIRERIHKNQKHQQKEVGVGHQNDTNSKNRVYGQKQPPEVFFKKRCSLRLRKSHRKTPETLAQMFSCEFCEISKNSFSTEHLRSLLLY